MDGLLRLIMPIMGWESAGSEVHFSLSSFDGLLHVVPVRQRIVTAKQSKPIIQDLEWLEFEIYQDQNLPYTSRAFHSYL